MLRPVDVGDANFITELRSNPERNTYINSTSGRVEDQVAWIERYLERAGDWYFIVVDRESNEREGTIGLYDYEPNNRVAEWGRWILRPGSLAAVESALLIYRTAFDALSLQAVFCRTIADNKRVVSFHDSAGVPRRALLKKHVQIGGRTFDSVEHYLDRKTWDSIQPNLDHVAEWFASSDTPRQ
jgi:RimJ/RimL family protein N-acetyltransferase